MERPIETPRPARTRALVLGAARSGKSLLFDCLVKATAQHTPVWLVDPLWEHVAPPRGCLCRPPLAESDEQGEAFEFVGAVADQAARHGNIVLAMDEADVCVGPGQRGPAPVANIVMHGAHLPRETGAGVGYLFATRRPAEIPRAWTSQALDFYLFRMSEPRDLEYARQRGADPTVVRGLAVGQFLHLQPGHEPHVHNAPWERCG